MKKLRDLWPGTFFLNYLRYNDLLKYTRQEANKQPFSTGETGVSQWAVPKSACKFWQVSPTTNERRFC